MIKKKRYIDFSFFIIYALKELSTMMLFDSYKFIDLTHLITPNIPTWDRTCGFSVENIKDYDPHSPRYHSPHMEAGLGYQIDAPGHVIRGGDSIDDIPS